jgi:hypothetical protein
MPDRAERPTNIENRERPYTCPQCGANLEFKSFCEVSKVSDIDPVTGRIGDEEHADVTESEQVDYVLRCTGDVCDWELWEDEDYDQGQPQGQTPNSLSIQ